MTAARYLGGRRSATQSELFIDALQRCRQEMKWAKLTARASQLMGLGWATPCAQARSEWRFP
jgi:hypothetical protein